MTFSWKEQQNEDDEKEKDNEQDKRNEKVLQDSEDMKDKSGKEGDQETAEAKERQALLYDFDWILVKRDT